MSLHAAGVLRWKVDAHHGIFFLVSGEAPPVPVPAVGPLGAPGIPMLTVLQSVFLHVGAGGSFVGCREIGGVASRWAIQYRATWNFFNPGLNIPKYDGRCRGRLQSRPYTQHGGVPRRRRRSGAGPARAV